MATKKKVTTKKSAPKKVVRKAKSSSVTDESFTVTREKYPFMTYRITDQTVYWSILLILILLLGIWVVNIQISISEILNSIKL